MQEQQTIAPSNRRRAFIAVALLLVALAVGSVTAVNLFPTKASERSLALPNRPTVPVQAADQAKVLERFRAEERADPAQAARIQQTWTERLNGLAAEAAAQGRAADAWTERLNGLAAEAGDLPSVAVPTTPPWSGGSPYPPLPVPLYPTP
jgi:hypothetical protein